MKQTTYLGIEENKSREVYIDVVAGIMIFWMILGHCCYFSHQSVPYYSLLGFYMPWFFYKSGKFFVTRDRSAVLKKDTHKLLRYFMIYSGIGWVVWVVCGQMDGSLHLRDCFIQTLKLFIFNGSIKGNGALWFLLSLFIVRQLSNMLIVKLKMDISIPILAIACFVIAFTLYAIGWYNYSWWFGNVFSGMCFFLLGYWLKNKENNTALFIISTLFFALIVLAYCVGWVGDFPYLYMHANKMYKGNYLLFYPTALAGIIMTNNFFRLLCKHVRFSILEYIGKNSMTFYTTHWILFVIVTFVTHYFFNVEKPVILFIILLGSCIVFLPLINVLIRSIKSKQ